MKRATGDPPVGPLPERHQGMSRYAANAVTALRVLLTPLFAWSVARSDGGLTGWLAAALFVVIAASDFVDGRLARRLGAASHVGRLLDHLADIAFIMSALLAYAGRGVVPWWVPAAIGASFTVYVVDSWWGSGTRGLPALVGSRIGHAGGVLNYGLIGILVGNESMGLHLLSPSMMSGLYLLVPLYSGAAIATRLRRR